MLCYGRVEIVTEGLRAVTRNAIELRRWFGKMALVLVLLWAVVGLATIGGIARGASAPALHLVLLVVPAIAFVPAAYFAVALHRTDDEERINKLWPRALGLAVLGMVVFLGSLYGFYKAGK